MGPFAEDESTLAGVCCHHTEVGVLSPTEVTEAGESGASLREVETEATEPEPADEEPASEGVLPRLPRLWAAGRGVFREVFAISSSLSKASCPQGGEGNRGQQAQERVGAGRSLPKDWCIAVVVVLPTLKCSSDCLRS